MVSAGMVNAAAVKCDFRAETQFCAFSPSKVDSTTSVNYLFGPPLTLKSKLRLCEAIPPLRRRPGASSIFI